MIYWHKRARISTALAAVLIPFLLPLCCAAHEPQVLMDAEHHLRQGEAREWNEFPESAEGEHIEVPFEIGDPRREYALLVRQRDVKQVWQVLLNDRAIGNLIQDENDLTLALPIPNDALLQGGNRLRFVPHMPSAKRNQRSHPLSDDIYLGPVRLVPQPMREFLHQSTLDIEVRAAGTDERLPCRLTIIDVNGSLAPLDVEPNESIALRTGVVYSGNGRATLHLPAGEYRIYAGRGFEYGLARAQVALAAGQTESLVLELERQVATRGMVSCDTHIHTLTHSGHGDATIAERMITLAGENIELAIATDHNLHVDFEKEARRQKVRQYFTPVVGNEVTTSVGHFNVFPVRLEAQPPNHELRDWTSLFDAIFATPDVRVVILNHPRDLHAQMRPFDPKRHNALVGQNLDGWSMRFNAMEVINSGATQNDVLRLPQDWMGLLNGGYTVTPVGSSDSHDVARHFVGQGRTYIAVDDHDPANIPVGKAIDSLLAGRVVVSYGLFADVKVNGQFGPGDLVPASAGIDVDVRVLAPDWIEADHVALYANGQLVREERIPANHDSGGTKWSGTWHLDSPAHDVHLVVIATGPGIEQPYWRTAKPYQPTSTSWQSRVMSCTGAIWVDGDADGKRTSAREYAQRLLQASQQDLQILVDSLKPFDRAVAAQAAHEYIAEHGPPTAQQEAQWLGGAEATAEGYREYLEAWRASQIARAAE